MEPAPDPLPAALRAPRKQRQNSSVHRSACRRATAGCMSFCPMRPGSADYLDLVAAVEDTCAASAEARVDRGLRPALRSAAARPSASPPTPAFSRSICRPRATGTSLKRLNTVLFEEARRQSPDRGEVHLRRQPHRHRRRQPHRHRRGDRADSPILRRPDLLRSMVAFWQNHPSLSYLFSGMYVGPTSQYPRVDEARMDALYELEVAFSQSARARLPAVDSSTACSAICWSMSLETPIAPSSASTSSIRPRVWGCALACWSCAPSKWRRTIRMGLLQMLLIRALVCMFWKQPFEGGLMRWGTALHDRFMLPHFVQQRLCDVLESSARSGLRLRARSGSLRRWSSVFRKIGSIAAEGVELELRHALEPWNVLAEETTSGGTVRTVDSSLERMQVKLSGFTAESRYAVACNGRQVPLHAHRRAWGVRGGRPLSRARSYRLSLHPTIPVHAPLVFDIIDRWKSRSIGRCIYHVEPPNGRVYTTRPGNATEAKERRKERFQVADPPSGPAAVPAEEINPVFPMTLDLRWPASDQKTAHRKDGASTMTVRSGSDSAPTTEPSITSCRPTGYASAALGAPDGVACAQSARTSWHGAGPCRAPHPRERDHLQHLQRSARGKSSLADRHRSPADSGKRMAVHRSRHHPARPVAQSASRRPLRRAGAGGVWPLSCRAALCQPRIPPAPGGRDTCPPA